MKQLTLNKKIGIVVGLMFFTFLSLFVFLQKTHANPLSFQRYQTGFPFTQRATTSPDFLNPGVATSTIYGDAGQGNFGFDTASLALQMNASSSLNSTINWRYEYAQDTKGSDGRDVNCASNPTACDWYSDNMYQSGVTVSTTTGSSLSYVVNSNTYSWTYASSTESCSTGNSLLTNNRGCKIFTVPVPTRYIRAVVSAPIGSARSAVWGEFIIKKQVNSN